MGECSPREAPKKIIETMRKMVADKTLGLSANEKAAIEYALRKIASNQLTQHISREAGQMSPNGMAVEPKPEKNWPEFQRDLASLLNKYGMERPSNTQDFVLAEYLTQCLVAYNIAVECRRPPEASNVVTLR